MIEFEVKVPWANGLCMRRAIEIARLAQAYPQVDCFLKTTGGGKANGHAITELMQLEAGKGVNLKITLTTHNGDNKNFLTVLEQELKKMFKK